MSLPKISHPTFTTTLPSGMPVKYRPFTGREQKVLLFAKESGEASDVVRGLIEVVGACCEGLDVNQISIFDLEFLFLMIRAKSVGSKVELKVTDDGKTYDAFVEIDKAKIEQPKTKPERLVKVTDDVALKLRFPSAISIAEFSKDADEWDYLAASIEAVVSGDEVTSYKDVTREELREWLKTLPLTAVTPMKNFFESRPKVYLEAIYKVGDETKTKRVTGVGDFFE